MERVILCVRGAKVLQQMIALLVKTITQIQMIQAHVLANTDIFLIPMLTTVPLVIRPVITAQEAEPVPAISVSPL